MKRILIRLFRYLGYTVRKNNNLRNFDIAYKKLHTYTMIPKDLYIENLRLVIRYAENIDGDIVECGVWRGGMIAGIASLLGNTRAYHLFDSFEGLPKAKDIDGIEALNWQNDTNGEYYFDNCSAEIKYAEEAMGLAEVKKYSIHKGWFNETLPSFQTGDPIAVLRLDGDWYESTMDCLTNLFPLVNINGLIIIDDYFAWDGCSKAVHDFLSSIQSKSRIFTSENGVCYIIKKDTFHHNE